MRAVSTATGLLVWVAALALSCGSSSFSDAGADDAGEADCGCGALLCLPDGGCGACLSAPEDTCGAGQFCQAGTCMAGCKAASDCLSGRCGPTHDCESCQGDTECSAGRRCGSGVCTAPCPATPCAPGRACCEGACVDLQREIAACGQCGQACPADAFCGRGACHPLRLGTLCQLPEGTALRDGQPTDDLASFSMLTALAAACDGGLATRNVSQFEPGLLGPSGAPLRSGEFFTAGGGSFFQKVVGYLEREGLAPVIDTSTATTLRYSGRDGGVVAQRPLSGIGPDHDVFVVQLVRTPNGAAVLNAAGVYDNGTAAAAFYVTRVLLPAQLTELQGWYVVEWTDSNPDGLPDPADTFTLLASGR